MTRAERAAAQNAVPLVNRSPLSNDAAQNVVPRGKRIKWYIK